MILIDVYVPSMDKTYDFQVDENVSIENLVMEIAEMIGSETKSDKKSSQSGLLLCSLDDKVILQKNRSLHAYGIVNGSRLMLV
jgi:uncharacterized ubiquitin-like protein YukD